MIREKRRRKRRLKRVFISLLVIAFVIAIAALIIIKVFTVDKVDVEGNELYEDDVISKAILNDEYSWNSLYVFLKYKFKDTEEIPFIDTMEISLADPHTLHVTVYEKGLMGCMKLTGSDNYVYFDKDGFVVEISQERIAGVCLITGIKCEEVELYKKLPIKKSVLKNILLVTQTLKRDNLLPDSIRYGEEYSPIASYGNVRIQIGSITELTQKVERIRKILPKLKGQKGVLHLENWTEETTNIVFDKEN